jgi:DNA-binding NtrC family response regulator
MPEDMLAIARAAIEQQSEKAVFDVKLRSFLLDQQWPENMLELRSVIIRAVNLANPLPPQLRHFEAAMGADDGTSPEAEQGGSLLERFLREEKARYQSAVEILNLD